MKNNMVRLQSKKNRNIFYVYDLTTSPVDIDAYGKCYRGVCQHGKHVLIHEIIVGDNFRNPFMWHALYATHLRYDEPKIIPIIDVILVDKDVDSKSTLLPNDSNRFMSRLYLIEEEYTGVSLADIIQQNTSDKYTLESDAFIELKKLCNTNRVAFAKRVTYSILNLLGYMHSLGICANNVNPHSVILADDGDVKYREIHRFVDMLEKNFKGSTASTLDIPSPPLSYCSPEIFMRNRHDYYIDQRSDIYSVGLLLFFILSGHDPFVGGITEIIVQQIKGSLSLKEIEDLHLREVIRKATEKEPKKRYQTVDEFIEALDNTHDDSNYWFQKVLALFDVFHFCKKTRRYLMSFAVLVVTFCSNLMAQNTMQIHGKDGSVYEIFTENVDSITFGKEDSATVVEAELTGSWLWGNTEKGYYEVLTFNEDHTYTGYDNYFSYGFDTMTYGYWGQIGAMLTLQSNGFGYQRRYNWYITDMTENALAVMTKMGPFTYYKLHPDTIHLKVGESMPCINGDSFIFADGVTVRIADDGALEGVLPGTTYVEKLIAETNSIFAYKVLVE